MESVQIFWYYIIWHYTKAWQDSVRVIENYLWFVGNFFSINLLLRTLFSPWRRLSVSGGKGGEESFFGALLINTLMRGVGFLIRSATIVLGAVVVLLTIVLSAAFIVVWLCLPVLVVLFFLAGLGLFVKAFF